VRDRVPITWFKQGRWAHWAKIAFEKYYPYKMRRGGTEPIFEKWALQMIGLARLKSAPPPDRAGR